MNPYIERFHQYAAEHPLHYGYDDIHTLSDMLYDSFAEHNPIDSMDIRNSFRELDELFGRFTMMESDRILTVICRLCAQHEHLAFQQGMRVGAQIILELTTKKRRTAWVRLFWVTGNCGRS